MKYTGERMIPSHDKGVLVYGEHIVRYQASATLVKNKIVLDIASGSGYGTKILADSGAKKVYGVDISKEAIEYAKKNYNAKNIEYRVGDAAEIPLEDNSMDVVVSFETIEHVPKYEAFMKEICRVLKSDGVLIVSTPNDEEYPEGNEYHVHEFEIDEFKQLIKSNFKNHELYYQGAYVSSGVFAKTGFEKEWTNNVNLVKAIEQPSKKVVYLTAVCSNGALPVLEPIVSLAAPWNDRGHAEYIRGFENKIEAQENEINNLKNEIDATKSEINNMRSSKSWRYTEILRKAKHRLNRNDKQ